MVPAPPVGRGPTCPRGPWMVVGTVGGLASFLAGARSGNPIGSGAWGIPSSRPHGWGEHEAVRSRPDELKHLADHAAGAGGHADNELRLVVPPTSRRVWGGETADVAVAQPVVDEREEMSGRRHAADVETAAGTDAGLDRGDTPVTGGT